MSARKPYEGIGVWRALGEFKLKEAVWPEGTFALVIGGGGSVLIVRATQVSERVGVMNEIMALAGGLLAVVFTALAIVVSLPSTSYLKMLGDTPEGGMRRFLDPFLVAVGVLIAVLLFALGHRLVAADVAWWVEHAAFYAIGFLFVFGVLDIASLARQLVRHGVLRATDAAILEEERKTSVRRLPDRRPGSEA